MNAILSTIIALLLGFCAWNLTNFSFLIFVAIVPVLLALNSTKLFTDKSRFKLLIYIVVFKFIWVFGQVFWLKDVTYDTFFAAVILHTLCFTIIQIPTILTFDRISRVYSLVLFLLGWVIFEFFMQNFALLSPFYILGVMLGEFELLIQSYAWIGIEGGTCWILFVNFVIFCLISKQAIAQSLSSKMVLISICILPFLFGFINKKINTETSKTVQVAALHTNFNPVNQAYELNPQLVIDSLWDLSSSISPQTDLLLWPETIVANIGWMQTLAESPALDSLNDRLQSFPELNVTFGTNIFGTTTDVTDERLNYSSKFNFHYYVYNVAMTKKHDENLAFRSKEIFVPFQEAVPYVQKFPSLKKLISVVGNTNFYTNYEYDQDIQTIKNDIRYTTLLCYEICFPMFTSTLSKESDFMVVLGNEHWNSSEKGSELYFNILKSITAQNGKPLIKSSNNGISVCLDRFGRVEEERSFSDTGLIQQEISIPKRRSFYSYISGYSFVLAFLGIAIIIVRRSRLKKVS